MAGAMRWPKYGAHEELGDYALSVNPSTSKKGSVRAEAGP
jgi:hypothetical protein